jgi:hypothetical protein
MCPSSESKVAKQAPAQRPRQAAAPHHLLCRHQQTSPDNSAHKRQFPTLARVPPRPSTLALSHPSTHPPQHSRHTTHQAKPQPGSQDQHPARGRNKPNDIAVVDSQPGSYSARALPSRREQPVHACSRWPSVGDARLANMTGFAYSTHTDRQPDHSLAPGLAEVGYAPRVDVMFLAQSPPGCRACAVCRVVLRANELGEGGQRGRLIRLVCSWKMVRWEVWVTVVPLMKGSIRALSQGCGGFGTVELWMWLFRNRGRSWYVCCLLPQTPRPLGNPQREDNSSSIVLSLQAFSAPFFGGSAQASLTRGHPRRVNPPPHHPRQPVSGGNMFPTSQAYTRPSLPW